jgi:putative transposase
MCQVLQVSVSGYYAWRGRPKSAREMANEMLSQQVEDVFYGSFETYGSPRVYRALKARGIACNENRVARLMKLRGLKAKQARRYRSTTRRNRRDAVAPNLLQRDFTADRPDQEWLTDITYIPTGEGWLYLAIVLDLYAQRVVGRAMSQTMTTELTLAALALALQRRRPDKGLLHHSDQGSQYTAQDYQAVLKARGIQASMNSVGSWYDNAPTESFFGTVKSELVNHCQCETRDEARAQVFYYIEAFYNRRRLHSSLGYLIEKPSRDRITRSA